MVCAFDLAFVFAAIVDLGLCGAAAFVGGVRGIVRAGELDIDVSMFGTLVWIGLAVALFCLGGLGVASLVGV